MSLTKKPKTEIFLTDKSSTQTEVSATLAMRPDMALKKISVEYVDMHFLHSPFVFKQANVLNLKDA